MHQTMIHSQTYPYSTQLKSSTTTTTTPAEDEVLTSTSSDDDTIFALSSGGGGASVGSGATAVAVIRMSGSSAFDALRELMSPYSLSGNVRQESKNGDDDISMIKVPKLPKARMASLRTLYDPLGDATASTTDVSALGQEYLSLGTPRNSTLSGIPS